MNIYKNLLQDFWSTVSNGRTKRKTDGRKYDQGHKLAVLKEFSNYYHGAGSKRAERRREFNQLKHHVRSVRITENSRCFVCRGRADFRHHIVMLKNSGINSKQNVVHLCNGCHAEIHPWLK